MRVLVTGAAGFIGRCVVDGLVANGHEVVALDLVDAPEATGRAVVAGAAVTWHRGDVRDVDVWRTLVPGTDGLCHLAARVGLGVDFADVGGYVSHNDVGTAAGLQALHELGWRGRLVLSSSMVVYGEGSYACIEHGRVRPGPRRAADLDAGRFEPPCPRCSRVLRAEQVDEDAPVDPRNVYAATKLHQEHLAAAFAREHGTTSTALRYHNVYGPGMPRATPYAGVASLFASALLAGRAPRVFEDGGQRRDFVHVHDVARANVAALTAPVAYDGPVNIASGRTTTVLEMATALSQSCGGHAPVVTGEYRLGDVRHVTASPERAAAALGFRATTPLAQGVADVLADARRAGR